MENIRKPKKKPYSQERRIIMRAYQKLREEAEKKREEYENPH